MKRYVKPATMTVRCEMAEMVANSIGVSSSGSDGSGCLVRGYRGDWDEEE